MGVIMNKGEQIYYNIQEKGIRKIEVVAEKVLRDLTPILGELSFPRTISSINKIYILLERGYYSWMKKTLEKYGYDYGVELQYLMMNLAYGEITGQCDQIRKSIVRFPSIDRVYSEGLYQLETKLGTIMLEPLTRYSKDSEIKRFALQHRAHGMCHVASLQFIQRHPSYRAVTSLVANQFGEQQYHSYIETSDGYADLSNNIHLSKGDFDKVMRPQVLNTVTGYELSQQEKQLNAEDLPDSKTLLLRLAVHEQIKGLK